MAVTGRHISIVIVGTMVIWFSAQILGGKLGLPGRYALLFDFAALAALIYAGINILRLQRMRQKDRR